MSFDAVLNVSWKAYLEIRDTPCWATYASMHMCYVFQAYLAIWDTPKLTTSCQWWASVLWLPYHWKRISKSEIRHVEQHMLAFTCVAFFQLTKLSWNVSAIVCCKNASCTKSLRVPSVRWLLSTKLSLDKRPELCTFSKSGNAQIHRDSLNSDFQLTGLCEMCPR